MDLTSVLDNLRAELDRVKMAIAILEQFGSPVVPVAPLVEKRRGRKTVPPSERAAISERMRKYWAGKSRKPQE